MRKPDYNRRVVVTGLGVISPVGNDVPTAWDNLVDGRIGPRPRSPASTPSRYEAKAAGEVKDFDAPRLAGRQGRPGGPSRALHFGVAAAKQAVADSGFEITDENRDRGRRRLRLAAPAGSS